MISQSGEKGPSAFIRAQNMFGNINDEICKLSSMLLSFVPSTAGVERTFNTMGFIHNDVRNKLRKSEIFKQKSVSNSLKRFLLLRSVVFLTLVVPKRYAKITLQYFFVLATIQS